MSVLKRIVPIVIAFGSVCCQKSEQKEYLIQGQAQGTTYHIKYIGQENLYLKKSIDSILEVIDKSMSTYRSDSFISRFNRGEDTQADEHFIRVFNASKQVWEQSDGLFDPTVGALVELWGFGRVSHKHKPSEQQVSQLLEHVGLNKLSIDNKGVIHSEGHTDINFNAIAQGYSVDIISSYLKEKSIHNFVIELGGEIYVSGSNTIQKKLWRLGIDNPMQSIDKRELIAVIEITDKAVATSGNYRKLWTDSQTGQQFVHTLNPKTGMPELSDVLSVTVVTQKAMDADAYATAFMVMGLEKTKKFIEQHPEIDVYINYSEKNEMKQYVSPGFKKYMVDIQK